MTSSEHETYVLALMKEIGSMAVEYETNAGSNEFSRSKVLEISSKLTTALQTPQETIIQQLMFPPQPTCIRLGISLDLFRIISKRGNKSISTVELAAMCGADLRLVKQIMRVLAAIGFVMESDEEMYKSSMLTQEMIKPSIEGAVKACYDIGAKTAYEAPDYFELNGYKYPTGPTDTPFQNALKTNLDYFKYLNEHPEQAKAFQSWMIVNQIQKPNWLEWFPVQTQILDGFDKNKGDNALLVDIGGGHGQYLELFKKRFPHSGRLILQDLSYAIDTLNLSEGIETMSHNFFDPQPVRGARVFFLHWILHDWSDQEAGRILRHIASAMTPGYSKLIINESILPDKQCPLAYAAMSIMMMVQTASHERSRKEWRELLQSAGLEVVEFYDPPVVGEGVIEVIRKD
ncbi:MAG: hypothetical protein M1834_008493 [Cirrosporium novae-zelandiae]|nr:MAG: hypothetical protein M1834_008493 [Cirrosporium novae-zelandiae]